MSKKHRIGFAERIKLGYRLGKTYAEIRRIIDMKKSWQTTLGGILVAIGTLATQIENPAWVSPVGAALVALGGLLTGVAARDNFVSSQDVGIRPSVKPEVISYSTTSKPDLP